MEGISHICANCQTNVGLEPLTKRHRANSIILQFCRFYWFPVSLKSKIFSPLSWEDFFLVTTSLTNHLCTTQNRGPNIWGCKTVGQQPPARRPFSSRANNKKGKGDVQVFHPHALIPLPLPQQWPSLPSNASLLETSVSQSQDATGRDLGVLRPSLEFKSAANKTKEEHRWLKPKLSAGSHYSSGMTIRWKEKTHQKKCVDLNNGKFLHLHNYPTFLIVREADVKTQAHFSPPGRCSLQKKKKGWEAEKPVQILYIDASQSWSHQRNMSW